MSSLGVNEIPRDRGSSGTNRRNRIIPCSGSSIDSEGVTPRSGMPLKLQEGALARVLIRALIMDLHMTQWRLTKLLFNRIVESRDLVSRYEVESPRAVVCRPRRNSCTASPFPYRLRVRTSENPSFRLVTLRETPFRLGSSSFVLSRFFSRRVGHAEAFDFQQNDMTPSLKVIVRLFRIAIGKWTSRTGTGDPTLSSVTARDEETEKWNRWRVSRDES